MAASSTSRPRLQPREITGIVDAARSVIAFKGLAGMSLRGVAEEAGTSVGSISHRIGDRGSLIVAVLEREIELLSNTRSEWRERTAGHDPFALGTLPDLVCEWLDQGAGARRTSAIVTCELALLASREPDLLPRIAVLLEGMEALWCDLLPATPEGKGLAHLIACYCQDEQIFTILLSTRTDYRLLRHSTIRGLLRGDRPLADRSATNWHMALVDRLAAPASAAHDATARPPEGTKGVLADHIADVIVSQGVGALSHRTVAQAAGVASSSVAHHFPSQRDVLFAGVEAVYRRMRSRILDSGARLASSDIVRLTHECALAALSDPAFVPFAIDMRRRRAENVHAQIAQWLEIPENSDRAKVQAIVMASIGRSLQTLATGKGLLNSFNVVQRLMNRTPVLQHPYIHE